MALYGVTQSYRVHISHNGRGEVHTVTYINNYTITGPSYPDVVTVKVTTVPYHPLYHYYWYR